MRRILRIDLGSERFAFSDNKYDKLLAGRGLTSLIVSEEIPPVCDPLGKHNKLVIAPALLSGNPAVNVNRTSFGSKSPLTGGIKESNVGGTLALALSKHDLAAIILEGRRQAKGYYILEILDEEVRFLDAGAVAGLANYDAVARLKAMFPEAASIITIGTAGEMRLMAATIAVTDPEGNPSRHAGRGGLGAVMGSMGIKAIIVSKGNRKPPAPADLDGFKAVAAEWGKKLVAEKKNLALYGNAQIVDTSNAIGALPVKNYRMGRFEAASKITGTEIARLQAIRGGRMGHACSPSCVIRCSNVFHGPDGKYLTSGLEYESIGMLGSNLMIGDIDEIARIEKKCDDYGLDTIEIGAAIGVAMDCGLLEFGDSESAKALLDEIGKGTVTGRLIGNGAAITGKVLGAGRIPVVKGQSLAGYDPRALKGTGVTYASSPMGGDHTAGNVMPGRKGLDLNLPEVLPHLPEGQTVLSGDLQIMAAILDCYICIYVGYNKDTVERLAALLTAYLGETVTLDRLVENGRSILRTERNYNEAAGIGPQEDDLPAFFREEPIEPDGYVFDVRKEDILAMRK